jgi:hypothetical protein
VKDLDELGEPDARQKSSLDGLGLHGEEPPLVWNAPQFVFTSLLEHEAGAGYQVLHGLGDEHFGG